MQPIVCNSPKCSQRLTPRPRHRRCTNAHYKWTHQVVPPKAIMTSPKLRRQPSVTVAMLYDFIQVSPLELVIGLKITDVVIANTQLLQFACQGTSSISTAISPAPVPRDASIMIHLRPMLRIRLVNVAIKATTVRAAVARFPENSNLVAHS